MIRISAGIVMVVARTIDFFRLINCSWEGINNYNGGTRFGFTLIVPSRIMMRISAGIVMIVARVVIFGLINRRRDWINN